jgi:hypothetical protein
MKTGSDADDKFSLVIRNPCRIVSGAGRKGCLMKSDHFPGHARRVLFILILEE